MNIAVSINDAIHHRFCGDLSVTPVPIGYAVSTGFVMPDGDPLVFYVLEKNGLWMLQDDGMTIPNALASGIDITSGHREQLLNTILADEGARFDPSDMTIYTDPMDEGQLGEAAISFVSGMIRMKDLFVVSQDNVRASFADDVRATLTKRLGDRYLTETNTSAKTDDPDVLLRDPSTHLAKARVFAAASDVRMLEAVIAHGETELGDSPVVAVVDRRRGGVSERRFNWATNKGLALAAYDGISDDWVSRVAKEAA